MCCSLLLKTQTAKGTKKQLHIMSTTIVHAHHFKNSMLIQPLFDRVELFSSFFFFALFCDQTQSKVNKHKRKSSRDSKRNHSLNSTHTLPTLVSETLVQRKRIFVVLHLSSRPITFFLYCVHWPIRLRKFFAQDLVPRLVPVGSASVVSVVCNCCWFHDVMFSCSHSFLLDGHSYCHLLFAVAVVGVTASDVAIVA